MSEHLRDWSTEDHWVANDHWVAVATGPKIAMQPSLRNGCELASVRV